MSSEPTRFFERAEAEALLPEVDQLLETAQALFARLREARRRTSESTRTNGHVIVNGSSSEFQSIEFQLQDIVRQIVEHGIIVRDIETGLIDFPSIRDGQPIYLCWRRGEPLRIEWWHPTSTGIAGRRRLD